MAVTRGIREAFESFGYPSRRTWGWEAFVQNGDGSVPCAHLHKSPTAALKCSKTMLEAAGHTIHAADIPKRRRSIR